MSPITDADIEITPDSPPWTCIYCGTIWPATDPVKVLQDHVLECTEHPAHALRVERDELRATFDLRWEADMRAIKMWQEAHPGNELVWPDHADMVVWLLEQLDKVRPVRSKINYRIVNEDEGDESP